MKAKRIAELKNAMAIARMNHDFATVAVICTELSAVIATGSKPCSDQLRAELTANNIEMNRLTERNDVILSALRGRGLEPVRVRDDVKCKVRFVVDKPLSDEQLRAGDWYCKDITEDCRNALLSSGIQSMSPSWPCKMHDYEYCAMGYDSAILLREVDLADYAYGKLGEGVALREIIRKGNEFYYV